MDRLRRAMIMAVRDWALLDESRIPAALTGTPAGIAAPYENETAYRFASDLNSPRRFETLAGLLVDRGYGESCVEKILGANLVRVFADTWARA